MLRNKHTDDLGDDHKWTCYKSERNHYQYKKYKKTVSCPDLFDEIGPFLP